tara:strand:+ start:14847 stop:15059 length:213 start_codon:yes stop_codon:yes gene_type:complete
MRGSERAVVRPGEPATLITAELSWQSRLPLRKDIISSAWEWHKSNPEGYKEWMAWSPLRGWPEIFPRYRP